MVTDSPHDSRDNPDKPPAEKQRSEANADLEREIRRGRKFSLAEAIGRLAGPGAMKGMSPIARKQQAEVEIEDWLRQHLMTAEEALGIVLLRYVKASDLLLNNYDQPLIVLVACCQQALDSEALLTRLVRAADIELLRPEDPYTQESVQRALSRLTAELAAAEGSATWRKTLLRSR